MKYDAEFWNWKICPKMCAKHRIDVLKETDSCKCLCRMTLMVLSRETNWFWWISLLLGVGPAE